MTRVLTIAVVGLVLVSLAACGGEEERVFRFTALPDKDTSELKRKFEPVADRLAEVLGVKVEYVPSADYQASVEMFKNGDVQMAWFGGLTGVQTRNAVPGAKAIAMGEKDLEFRSYFIAHKDTGLTRSEEFPEAIAKLKFTFGSASSTSGRLMPEHFIMENTGKTAAEFFETQPGFSGKHDLTAKLVESGSFQAGALNFSTYDSMVADGKLDPEVCRIIWVTPPYADYNITIHPEVDEAFGAGFADRVQKALLGLDTELTKSSFGRRKLIPATDEHFAGIVDVARKLDLLR
jgi:phosphonate transport system substrate-binding protein